MHFLFMSFGHYSLWVVCLFLAVVVLFKTLNTSPFEFANIHSHSLGVFSFPPQYSLITEPLCLSSKISVFSFRLHFCDLFEKSLPTQGHEYILPGFCLNVLLVSFHVTCTVHLVLILVYGRVQTIFFHHGLTQHQ